MIAWLQGQKLEIWRQGNRQGVLLACGGVGYEVQTSSKYLDEIDSQQNLVLWTHHLQREDSETLFGFPNRNERDLFRMLIGVNGIGPQLALVLLERFETNELVEALIEADLDKLCQAQGVGKRTAERLTIELRTKLSPWMEKKGKPQLEASNESNTKHFKTKNFEELHSSLSSLGYEDIEIRKAYQAIEAQNTSKTGEKDSPYTPLDDPENLLRASLLWLTREAA